MKFLVWFIRILSERENYTELIISMVDDGWSIEATIFFFSANQICPKTTNMFYKNITFSGKSEFLLRQQLDEN